MRFLLALLLLFSAALHSQDVIEEIVAIVNDDIITLSEYRAEYQANLQSLRAQFQGEEFGRQLEQMRKGLLNQMITDVLLLQEASKMEGLNVDEQMKLYIDNLKKENNIESDEEFIRILRQQGSDYDEWRAVLKKNMMKEAVVVTNVHQSIVIDEAEVVSYHKLHPEEFTDPPEYKLKGILISSGAGSDEGLEAKKREISGKIAAGEDFGALASEYSVGPEKEANGDLGIFKKGELAKDLEGAVENLKEGEITPWIQMRNVWYLLKLEEKKEA
ncbi:MAG: peptidylprolyl isomerase, partial [Candidatus Aminicenantes bacterium]|nr:peptidylprolyl isomerase [Candidatus Aminicenantes bacterium]